MAVDTLTFVTAGSVAGGLVSLAMVGLAWRNRETPAALAFGSLMAAISGWCFLAAASLFARDAGTAYLLDRLIRLVSPHVAPLFLVFVLSYAGYTRWLAPRWLAAYWLSTVAYGLLSVTGPWHPLVSGPADVEMVTASGLTVPTVHTQAAADVQLTIAYLLILAAYWVLFDFQRRSRSSHRHQISLIAIGGLLPFVANVGFSVGLSVHPGIDLTPITFTVTGAVLGWALFRHDFLKSVPVATDLFLEQFPDPVMVLDEDDCVMDFNSAALAAFGHDDMAEMDVEEAAPGLGRRLETEDVYSLPNRHTAEGRSVSFYDPQVSTVADQHGHERGRLVVLRDITGQQRRQDRLEGLQAATQQFISAQTVEEIAGLTVGFVEDALERQVAGVFLLDGDTLRPTAVTDSIREMYGEGGLIFDREHPVFQAFEAQEQRTNFVDEDSPIEWYAVFPLGDYGVLGVASRQEDHLASDDEQFLKILARSTQVALAQVEREYELRESRVSMERRSEQIEFFNGVLRHTQRNALLVIQGRTDHLEAHVDADNRHHLDVIDEWCEDLAALSDEMRAINDTVTATESERLGDVDLTGLLFTQVRRIEGKFQDVEITLDVEDGLDIQANKLAGRVVESIILNAVEHNDADVPRVRIRTQRASNRVQVYVADNGPGMDDELKEKVLERDIATSQTSHGFGLYFVSVMMNLFGGTVWFEDNDPNGTIACLEFKAVE